MVGHLERWYIGVWIISAVSGRTVRLDIARIGQLCRVGKAALAQDFEHGPVASSSALFASTGKFIC